jgi:hypothetical protein
MRTTTKRTIVALTGVVALAAPLALVAHAAVVPPSTARSGSLTQVGPVAANGFPSWYRDSNGIRLEGCWQSGDPLCEPLADEIPNPDAPTSYPENFPGEHFYQMADASLAAGVAGTVDVVLNVEGAFAADEVIAGDEMVFGRVRIRAKGAANGTYRITHPYGIDEFNVTDGAGINMTEDVGTVPGAFGGALQGRVGPYLTWDTFGTTGAGAPPAGYIGDPGIPHKVKGSPYGTNLVRVERKDAAGAWQTIGTTDLFTVQGRLAVNAGVDVQQATYRTMSDGTHVVEVFASSEAGEAIRLVSPGLGYKGITLEEDNYTVTTGGSSHQEGRYYGRFAVKPGVDVTGGADATTIVIQNAGDVPVSSKTVKLSDVVTVTEASYDGSTLDVEASSSDPGATLTVTGYGALTGGSARFDDVDAPPHVITVTSDEGGSATVPLGTSGSFTAPDLPVAAVVATPTKPIAGQPVTLDATGSLDASSFDWTVLSTPDGADPISGLSGATTSFTPSVAGTYEFSVVAIGDSGRSPAQPISVQVVAPSAVVTAVTGDPQTVQRGTTVTLDGSQSIGAATYRWQQVPNVAGETIPADHVVALSSATAAKPTFRFPTMALPAAPGPNATYTAVATPLRFRLTVTGVDGSTTSTSETVVRPGAEALTVTARYRTRGEWRVSGTSDLKLGQKVAVVLGSSRDAAGQPTLTSARGRVVGFANVDATGAWSYTGTGPDPRTAPAATTVTAVSAQGGQAISTINVTN